MLMVPIRFSVIANYCLRDRHYELMIISLSVDYQHRYLA